MLLNSTQVNAGYTQVATRRRVRLVATQGRGTERESCSLDGWGWEVNPRVETAVGTDQVFRKLQHEAKVVPINTFLEPVS